MPEPIRGAPTPAPATAPRSRHPVESSEWWLDRLSRALQSRRKRFELLDAYHRGSRSTIQLASKAFREARLDVLFPNLNVNHSRLIVKAAAQRLVVLGFRMPDAVSADAAAATIWRRNEMDGMIRTAFLEALVKGECPVLVEPGPDGPVITPQDPALAIVWNAPGDRRIRRAALKLWWDDDEGVWLATLFLPDRIERWQTKDRTEPWTTTGAGPTWVHRRSREDDWSVANPLGEVPMVVIPNDPRLTGTPEGEHEAVLSLIDLYAKTVMDMATAAHFAGRQKWGAGVEAKAEGGAEPEAELGPDTMLTSQYPDARFGTFEEADLGGYVVALSTIMANIAASTFTPYHFLLNMPSSVPPSGEAITATEAPLVDKVRGHHSDKAPALRRIMALALRLAGDEKAATAMRDAGEVIWADPERRTESQHVDAITKLAAATGMPAEVVLEMLPATPEQIARWMRLREQSRAADAAAPAVTRDQAEILGMLVRTGYTAASAESGAGIGLPLQHTGRLPVTLQPDASDRMNPLQLQEDGA